MMRVFKKSFGEKKIIADNDYCLDNKLSVITLYCLLNKHINLIIMRKKVNRRNTQKELSNNTYTPPEFIGFRTTAADREYLKVIHDELGVNSSSELLRNSIKNNAERIKSRKGQAA